MNVGSFWMRLWCRAEMLPKWGQTIKLEAKATEWLVYPNCIIWLFDNIIFNQISSYGNAFFSRTRRSVTPEWIQTIFCVSSLWMDLAICLQWYTNLVQAFGKGEGANFGLSHWLWHLTLRVAAPRRAYAWSCTRTIDRIDYIAGVAAGEEGAAAAA